MASRNQDRDLRTVVVPAAGMGTRFLPATKTVPKELLPVVDTPGIEIIAEEAAAAGARRLAVVTAPSKDGVLAHFDARPDLESILRERGKDAIADKVNRATEVIDLTATVQERPLGLGHAVLCAEGQLDDDEDAFAVMLPDDLVLPVGVMDRMVEVRKKFGGSVLCALETPREEIHNYGVFDIADHAAEGFDDVRAVRGMVEKPDAEDAPSNFAAVGRYLLDRKIFDALREIPRGKGGEFQLTDAIEALIEQGEPVHIVVHNGFRHDLGNPGGYIRACVDFALRSEQYGSGLRKYLEQRLADED
ncbi:UTP--glucose-1-phosphate uridylyltransferase [Corynebacterium sp. TAE3-ERU12]|uniref:UTP--glucose-1-phosphate uridylyltransferase n=1 Tax=Corynebacterium sp. TAE3-ERU12 TaxID=2849491 RepID=UPI001C450AF6|nr:UTP--glucose-1-phosphate uridylyltransferase [Corynebacterium sp. TAE3-ERU12]MBV7295600.1 UTP--glucose-1-phosphate uridylyltransferase [Corynebacterium sp. TAE3-ERU12]